MNARHWLCCHRVRRSCMVLLICSLGLAACGKSQEREDASGAGTAATTPNPPPGVADSPSIEVALASRERLAADREEDSWRKAEQVLRFLDVKPGMHVIDYFSGGGYYTELLSRIVGPQGAVIAYNNEQYRKYAGEKPAQRYGNKRLPNVVQVTARPEELALEPDSLDAALFVQSYHDLHWVAKDDSWPRTDPARALAQLVPALKPGAAVVVIDHVAAAGSDPEESVERLHRIDPAVIRRDFEAAGLKLEQESDLFRNPEDDHTRLVFDESIRRRTDQVMYKFRKE